MRRTREEKAITLIALIITIVVLLILAVVAINAVTGDGIIQHATNARSEYEKAQDAEEDMLAYYEGILQSGEIVPTVEQLDEKYDFEYYAKLSDAIKTVNGETVQTVNVENAVAGIYEDNENKYVVLMKDTEESETINVSQDVTINLGGKTLSFTTESAYLNIVADTECTIDGRIGGSIVQKNIASASDKGIIYAEGNASLEINSGKYVMQGEYSKGLRMFWVGTSTINAKVFKIYNANMILKNNSSTASSTDATYGLLYTIADESLINNCEINITSTVGISKPILFRTGDNIIKNSNIYGSSDNNITDSFTVVGVTNAGTLTIEDSNIYSESNGIMTIGIYNVEGTLKSYSTNASATGCGIYTTNNNSEVCIYGGNFIGNTYGGIHIKGSNNKVYIENATIQNGEYNGKYDISPSKDYAFVIGGNSSSSNNEVYIDNCNIAGENIGILVSNAGGATENILKISNSEVTGTVKIYANQYLYIGEGMNITAEGTGSIINEDVSYNGMYNF